MNTEDINNWWVKWWYLPTGTDNFKIDTALIPNFKEMNEAVIRLSDKKTRCDFITKAVDIIDKKLAEVFK